MITIENLPDFCISQGLTKPFDENLQNELDKKLDILYQNKALMLEASVAFIVIFLSFLNDPAYYVKGISAKGIYPK